MLFPALKEYCLQQGVHHDIEKIERAYRMAERVHAGQYRKSGEPYITHPIEVAYIAAKVGGDDGLICAALLHDCIEDADDPSAVDEEIFQTFGPDVHFLIHAVSKDNTIMDKQEQQAAFFQQFEEAVRLDPTVFFLKVADIIHNLSTLGSLEPSKKERWMDELKYEYLPIFSRNFHVLPLRHRHMYAEVLEEMGNILDEHHAPTGV